MYKRIGKLLYLFLKPLDVVLAQMLLLFGLLEIFDDVAPDVSDRNPCFFRPLFYYLDELLPSLFGKLRDIDPDGLPVIAGSEAQI